MSDVTVAVYRVPMRSRRDDVEHGATIERALTLGLCGFGEAADDGRSTRRVERFAEVGDGSFVWTRDTDGLYWHGRIVGPYFYDANDDAAAVDLVHVRECRWLAEPLLEQAASTSSMPIARRGVMVMRLTVTKCGEGNTERALEMWLETWLEDQAPADERALIIDTAAAHKDIADILHVRDRGERPARPAGLD